MGDDESEAVCSIRGDRNGLSKSKLEFSRSAKMTSGSARKRKSANVRKRNFKNESGFRFGRSGPNEKSQERIFDTGKEEETAGEWLIGTEAEWKEMLLCAFAETADDEGGGGLEEAADAEGAGAPEHPQRSDCAIAGFGFERGWLGE